MESSGSKSLVFFGPLIYKVSMCFDCSLPSTDCAMLIERNDLPNQLFGIPDLDLSDLCPEPLTGPWFRLEASSTGFGSDG